MKNEILLQDMEEIYSRRNDWDKLNKKTILLTGAYGMLASYITYFITYMNEYKNINVKLIALVRRKNKFYKRFFFLEEAEYIQVIENNLESPIEINQDIDYIIHAASLASPQHYGVHPVEVLKPNVLGNYFLLELARKKKIKGYLLFSTGDIYGSAIRNGKISEEDYGVMDTLDIHNCYSESKRMAETMCKSYYVQYGIPTKIARIWHTYAPTMDIKEDPRVFSSFIKNIVSNEDIAIQSDGKGKRSFCYITDAIVGYFTILLDGKSGAAYNVCNSSQFVSIEELANILIEIKPSKKLNVIKTKRNNSDNYVENILLVGKENIPSNQKLKELGWNAEIDIKEGFKRVIEYMEIEDKMNERYV